MSTLHTNVSVGQEIKISVRTRSIPRGHLSSRTVWQALLPAAIVSLPTKKGTLRTKNSLLTNGRLVVWPQMHTGKYMITVDDVVYGRFATCVGLRTSVWLQRACCGDYVLLCPCTPSLIMFGSRTGKAAKEERHTNVPLPQ